MSTANMPTANMSTDDGVLPTNVAEAAEDSARVKMKHEATQEDDQLDSECVEYPVESVYIKGEPPEEISFTMQESDDDVEAIECDVDPIEDAGSELADKDESSTGRRFIFDPVLGSYRKTDCPSPPPLSVEQDPLSAKPAKKPANKKKHPPTADRPFQCQLCEKSFALSYYLKSHMLTHTDERPFACSVCEKRFKFSGDVTVHMVIHSGERPFHCYECDKKFARRGDLRMHMFLHTGERRFSCDKCEKKFVRRVDLKNHTYSHTGERPFVCSYCARKFTLSGELKLHVLTHTGERPYACHLCDKKFARSSRLKNHVLNHTGHFKCQTCEKTFANDRNLRRHFTSAHAEESVAAKEPTGFVTYDDTLVDQGPSAVVT